MNRYARNLRRARVAAGAITAAPSPRAPTIPSWAELSRLTADQARALAARAGLPTDGARGAVLSRLNAARG